ncbi:MAG: leucyl aminopeptidase family protein [Flavobacteriales bacterium]|nr:leucyl aminopeptidase family protein [Flavobacteriales bacterium]
MAECKAARSALKDSDQFTLHHLDHAIHIVLVKSDKKGYQHLETLRSKGAEICAQINSAKRSSVHVVSENGAYLKALVEGLVLANYQFIKYRKDRKEKAHSLKRISVEGPMTAGELKKLKGLLESVYDTRDLVNEPFSHLTAPQLGKEIKKIGRSAGFKVEVMGRKKIEALKMGGLLAVNRGSLDDPTFSILEWKNPKAKNDKPIVLVGKGVVYDTGGLSLKPTPNSMDLMKSDMAGAAMMIGTMAAISRAELPLHVIALIPATDNRPGGNAYAPGDVVTMYDGTTVEVWNTDAEGRMLLADALSYAKKYSPDLVIDAATLTGAAIRALGPYASCVMGTADDRTFDRLEKAGFRTYERVVRMPFWKEYRKELDSDIADIKNLGGANAGQITAGKFLEHFTDYPWVHIDIAGPAFLTSKDSYRGKWGTGYGVRLLFEMLSQYP